MLVTIPDEVAKGYLAMAERQGRSLDAVVSAQLERFVEHAPGAGRCYTFSGPILERLENALGKTPTRSAKDVCSRVEQLAAISFGHLRFDFSSGQLAEIDRMASRQRKTPRQFVEEILHQMEGQFFNYVGGPAAPVRAKVVPVADLTPVGPDEGGSDAPA